MKSPNTVYRPRGMIKTDDDGFVFWREQTKDTWSKIELLYLYTIQV